MGEYAELAIELEINSEYFDSHEEDITYTRRHKKNEDTLPFGYWKTNDGQMMAISGMETKHIVNCLNRLVSLDLKDTPKYNELYNEILYRMGNRK